MNTTLLKWNGGHQTIEFSGYVIMTERKEPERKIPLGIASIWIL